MWRILKDSEIIRGQTRSACFQQIGINYCVYQAGIHLSYFQTQLLNLKFTCKVFEPIEFGAQQHPQNLNITSPMLAFLQVVTKGPQANKQCRVSIITHCTII